MRHTRQISVRLDHPGQLFEADGISPTSSAYTEFTAQPAIQTVRDLLLTNSPDRDDAVEMLLILPEEHITPGLDAELTEAVRRWIRVQNTIDGGASSASNAVGRRMFFIGAVSFVVLQALSLWLSDFSETVGLRVIDAVGQGLSVASWVMLWFPVQAFTVEAWRAGIRRRKAQVIERMTVRIQASNA